MTSASPATLSSIARGASGPPIAVLTQPGCIVSTVIGRPPTSFATKPRVSELSAALLAR